MASNLLTIVDLAFSFPPKVCLDGFSTTVTDADKIAVIGDNGSGKSTLLKIIAGFLRSEDGMVKIAPNAVIGNVPQMASPDSRLSGGQSFNAAFTEALSSNPDLLLLDEPTNHLDSSNRRELTRVLRNFRGALIVASHDAEFIGAFANALWHIDNGKIRAFKGTYENYLNSRESLRTESTKELAILERKKREALEKLERERQRIAKSKAFGKRKVQNDGRTKLEANFVKSRAEKDQGSKLKTIGDKKRKFIEKITELRLPETITPNFSIKASAITCRAIVGVSDGGVGYGDKFPIVENINLQIAPMDRIAIIGDNGSGKSTLIKALARNESIVKSGDWHLPKSDAIGYLDQRYATLDDNLSALDSILRAAPSIDYARAREHLNDFLFRKNEEVNILTKYLSGGEKARLSLAMIAINPPKLLILDEVTNNLDLKTKDHVTRVLKDYPGALIVVSHEDEFLKNARVNDRFRIANGRLDAV